MTQEHKDAVDTLLQVLKAGKKRLHAGIPTTYPNNYTQHPIVTETTIWTDEEVEKIKSKILNLTLIN